jgi:uncharacterized protein (TIGR03066 family)
MLKYVSVAVFLIVQTASSDDKPDYAKLIVGKWEVIKSSPGHWPEGVIFEFNKDGKMKATIKGDALEGTYSLKGKKLTIKFGIKEDDGLTITGISETEMTIEYDDDKEVVLKRSK